MRILIACEFSGVVRDAFIQKGHHVLSCDLLPTEKLGPHYQGDVFDVLDDNWDMMIAHPPCTYLCNSGVRWLHTDETRWPKMEKGACFFRRLLHSKIPKIAVENPIMHKYAKNIIGQNQDQIIQPWMFGHLETKATCLWLKGLPKLKEVNNVKSKMEKLPKKEKNRIHYLSGKDRGKERSITFQGIADAMAEQWG